MFDEAQRCPDLLSYFQSIVDADGRMGRYLLTGSRQFSLMSGIAQSLAGRTLTRESYVGLKKWCKLSGNRAVNPTLIYSSDETYGPKEVKIVSWRECGTLL